MDAYGNRWRPNRREPNRWGAEPAGAEPVGGRTGGAELVGPSRRVAEPELDLEKLYFGSHELPKA